MEAEGMHDEIQVTWWSSMGSACGVSVLGMIWPLVMLIWLNRAKIKDEIRLWP
jgi:hypothetical protein